MIPQIIGCPETPNAASSSRLGKEHRKSKGWRCSPRSKLPPNSRNHAAAGGNQRCSRQSGRSRRAGGLGRRRGACTGNRHSCSHRSGRGRWRSFSRRTCSRAPLSTKSGDFRGSVDCGKSCRSGSTCRCWCCGWAVERLGAVLSRYSRTSEKRGRWLAPGTWEHQIAAANHVTLVHLHPSTN